ncbi:MAG TPA: hypothetical protein PKI19_05145 [Elusimicrobiales bacterium]|nr:hypothetical protein [Elusimicrobiales bacterium]
MHILNFYFTPFAVILIAFAVYFSEPERSVTYAALGLLAAAFAVNYWLSANVYRLMQVTRSIRGITVWINLLTSAALFYLLAPYWAPMWLLFLTGPAAAAMFMKKWQVFLTALASASLMFGIYYLRSLIMDMELSPQLLGMIATQAVFIVFFSMFTSAMAEMAVKVRDSLR